MRLARYAARMGIDDCIQNFSRKDSSVSIVTRLRSERHGVGSWQGQGCFLFATASTPALGPSQYHIQWVPGALSLGIK
jgi:hypothetical protein